jgi:hypothetical protein
MSFSRKFPKAMRIIYILIAVVAFVMGICADRVLFSKRDEPSATSPVSDRARSSATASPTQEMQIASADEMSVKAESNAVPKKSLDVILAERDRKQRTADLEAFINNLQLSDYGAALKRIRQMPGSNDRELASRLLVSRWVQMDPTAALQFAASNRGFEYVADDVFQQEATTNLQGALERAKSLPNADLRYNALRGVLSFMADTNPAGALQLSQALGEFPGNEPLSSVIYRQWAAIDPQTAALAAAKENVDGWRSPVGQVVRTWAGKDPAAAANWSLSLGDPSAQSRSIGQVIRQWARQDPTAAANWVNALPPGSSHDAAVAAFAYSLVQSDPQYAVNWAQNIADEKTRNNALQRVSREVMWRNPTNGATILQAAGVPPNLIPQPTNRNRPPSR